MNAIRFYGVRRKLQRLQASTSNNKNDEEDLELLQSDSDTDTLESDYECPDYGKRYDAHSVTLTHYYVHK